MKKNKNNNRDFSFEKYDINFNSLKYYKLFMSIQKNGTVTNLNKEENFEKVFKRIKIKINPAEVKKTTLEEISKNTGIYRKYFPYLDKNSRKEIFYEFKDNEGNTYILSAIELIRYFYANSTSTQKALVHVMGLDLLIEKFAKKNQEYYVDLKNNCKKDHGSKAFYFFMDNEFKEMFNSVYINFMNENLLYAPFPSKKPFTIEANCYFPSKKRNEFLIYFIRQTDLYNDYNNILKNIIHPNDKVENKEKKSSKTNSVNCNIYESNINENMTFDDNKISDPDFGAIDIEMDDDEEVENIFHQSRDRVKYIKSGEKSKKQQAGNDNLTKRPKGLTTQDSTGHHRNGININILEKCYPNKLEDISCCNIDVNKVIDFFTNKDNRYQYIKKIFKFPDRNNGEKSPISYIDIEKSIKRKYILIRFYKKNDAFFYLEAEPRLNKNKEILIVKSNTTIDNFQNEKVIKIIYDQVNKGNHKWLSKNKHGIDDSIGRSFKHTENMLDNILKFVKN